MTVVAVTGARGALETAVIARLARDERVERIIGVDTVEPDMPAPKLEFRTADLRDPVLSRALDGADVVVHLGTDIGESMSRDLHFARVVQGTRQVLDATERIGALAFVHLSSTMVYGAHESNPVPLTEDTPRRVDPEALEAYHQLLAEELVLSFAAGHHDARVTVLRAAPVLGPGVESPVTRLLEAPRVPLVDGYETSFQFVDVDDLAEAVHLAALGSLSGAYNVAADGWLPADEAATLLGRRVTRFPETVLTSALGLLRAAGLARLGPGHLSYLMFPWVADTQRLRSAGWAPRLSHREILRAYAEVHHQWWRVGPLRVRRRVVYGVVGAIALLPVSLAGQQLRKRLQGRVI